MTKFYADTSDADEFKFGPGPHLAPLKASTVEEARSEVLAKFREAGTNVPFSGRHHRVRRTKSVVVWEVATLHVIEFEEMWKEMDAADRAVGEAVHEAAERAEYARLRDKFGDAVTPYRPGDSPPPGPPIVIDTLEDGSKPR